MLYQSVYRLHKIFANTPHGDSANTVWQTSSEGGLSSDAVIVVLSVYMFDQPLSQRFMVLARKYCPSLIHEPKIKEAGVDPKEAWRFRLVLIFLSLIMPSNNEADESNDKVSKDNNTLAMPVEQLILIVQGIYSLWHPSISNLIVSCTDVQQ